MDEPITKRLIISGLTPAITAEDISRRLTTFGTVKAADGFGLPDGLGNPRSFGYVTLDTTVGKLAKCMNLLSGSTWKGTKLRFGEAKPDFKERIMLENRKAAEEPPKKKRKRFGGVEADDMSLITTENVTERPGWKVSALGRITKPVKMRPAHPLPEITEDAKKKPGAVKFSDAKKSGVEGEKKKKKRTKDPDTRARRKVIDMTTYGSTHLKGMFLDLDTPMPTKRPERYQDKRPANEVIDSDAGSDDSDDSSSPAKAVTPTIQPIAAPKKLAVEPVVGSSKLETKSTPTKTPTPAPVPIPVPTPTLTPGPASIPAPPPAPKAKPTKAAPPPNTSSTISHDQTSSVALDHAVDIQKEKAQSLNLLNSLFGNNADDWVGQEDVDSDIDTSELVKGDRMLVDDDEPGFEVVPLNAPVKGVLPAPSSDESSSEKEEDEDKDNAKGVDKMDIDQQDTIPAASSKPKTLKDLFAPKEDEGGFSLLGYLDLDIELDEDPLTAELIAPQQPESYEPQAAPLPTIITLQTHPSQAPLVLDPRQALFFPLPRQDGFSNIRARQRDVFDLSKDNGWNWRDPAVGFYQTGTEEDIRKKWEESKGDLTKDWKRRCREAGKVNRRKRGGVEGDNEY
ncbi:hypothetical protein BDN70DRAFT_927457 [Pholiota conissans]|uniref:RRM domain-containing protein n=1 Tax=Pholiota conissans TaxID=109636 RepID=A0A9P5ZDM4_9AGAR|nr:hypothetical protein BDN70DRAFT_927457 [Pholiota conissans]